MFMRSLLVATMALPLPLSAVAQTTPDAAALRDAALQDNLAWEITEGLTTEIGPRLAATDAEARARDWSVAKLRALGFKNVRNEPFAMPVWVRGAETAEVLGRSAQPLVVTALGNSGSTGAQGLEGEIVHFATFEDLMAAPANSLTGKIAFVSHAMAPSQDGSSYDAFGAARRRGPSIAASKGAAAILIRSIGTSYHRVAHTGGTSWEKDQKPIPAAALALPDADQLTRLLQRGAVRVKLRITPEFKGQGQSGNVIAEVPGSDPGAGIVLIACHLDSWDLGTGAVDDASGCGIITAAAKRVMDAGQPRRTIRILWAGAEEPGVFGGEAYYRAHKDARHVVVAESDFGADRIWKVDTNLAGSAAPVVDRIVRALAPLGIARGSTTPLVGADVSAVADSGVAGIDLTQSGLDYFNLHHNADDTLDKVDPANLRQNVAAWTATVAIVANAPEEINAVKMAASSSD